MLRDRIRGCLLGGAVGDALGAPVEFLDLAAIRAGFGPHGPEDFAPWDGPEGGITDDTQMTLFTAEAVIRGLNRARVDGGGPSWPLVFRDSYWRWLATQGGRPQSELASLDVLSSWLSADPELNDRRSPGATCLSALRSGALGTPEDPINDSKGCGGVMRVAPVGLAGLGDPFRVGCEAAAVTHGHPSGWLAAGCLARLIHLLAGGSDLGTAVVLAVHEVRSQPGAEEVAEALGAAMRLAQSQPATPQGVESLGQGWVAEEALAIAVYCALTAATFEAGVRAAVNHSGDSDSTGAITGQILGALWGAEVIPVHWLGELELRPVIERVAEDLHRVAHDPTAWDERGAFDWDRYPG